MSRSIGSYLWQISVALYLFANGILGIQKGGDFAVIYRSFFGRGDLTSFLVLVTGIIALIAGIALLLELFEVKLGFLDVLILIIAIVWIVYIILEVVYWIQEKQFQKEFFHVLQMLAVHLMVLASLMIASKRFGE
jgi:hypothetical protein